MSEGLIIWLQYLNFTFLSLFKYGTFIKLYTYYKPQWKNFLIMLHYITYMYV